MAVFEIPLTSEPQTLVVTVGNAALRLSLQWCPEVSAPGSTWDGGGSVWDSGLSVWDVAPITAGSWMMDIATTAGNALAYGLPLVPGANILEQFDHLNIAGALWVQTVGDVDAIPAYDNLGTAGRLYLVTP